MEYEFAYKSEPNTIDWIFNERYWADFKESEDFITASGEEFELKVSRKTGALESYKYKGKES